MELSGPVRDDLPRTPLSGCPQTLPNVGILPAQRGYLMGDHTLRLTGKSQEGLQMYVTANGLKVFVATAAGAALVTSCGGGGSSAAGTANRKADAGAARVLISPPNGTAGVRPDDPVVVRATGGTLDDVVLNSGGSRIPGVFNRDRTQWQSRWTLKPGTKISVHASAQNPDGRRATAASSFDTEKANGTITASQDEILESRKGETYGVGLPIVLNFDHEVTNKAAVEKALQVIAEKPVLGAWHWFDNKQVVYRAKTYWPAHQTVKLVAHLSGVPMAKGVYGTKDLVRTYRIGAAQISYLAIDKHQMRVEWDGRTVRHVPISAGMGGSKEYTTTSGIHLNMEKDEDVVMTSPGRGPGDAGYYSELIHYAVRVSSAGEYLHQTPGDEGCLGNSNCSHGCIRQPAADAIWYYKHSQPGDPVDITGTDRPVEPDNGWSFYQMPWNQWLKGSALHR
jgi:lipoprotein-anchoring transpeptidase ErfK/SrfK